MDSSLDSYGRVSLQFFFGLHTRSAVRLPKTNTNHVKRREKVAWRFSGQRLVAPSDKPSPSASVNRTFHLPSPSVSTYPVTPSRPAHKTRSATPFPSVSTNR